MIIEGVKLMLVGMTTVLLFLCFTIVLIQLISRLTRETSSREVAAMRLEKRKRIGIRPEAVSAPDFEEDIAVIAAAVAAYEADCFVRH